MCDFAASMEAIKETDRLGNGAMNSAKRCMDVGASMKNAVGGGKGHMMGDPTVLLKVVPMLTDSKGFCDDMVGMVTEVVEDAVQMVVELNKVLDSCCGKCCKMCASAGDGSDPSDPPPADVSEDIDALEKLKDAFCGGSLLGIAKAGPDALDGIDDKAGMIGTLCQGVMDFCTAILNITSALVAGSPSKIPKEIGKLFRCIKLSDLMKQVAEELMRLVNIFADLFKAMVDKVHSLNPLNMAGDAAGAALAAAKDPLGAAGGAMGKIGGMF